MKLNDQKVTKGQQKKILLVKNKEKIVKFRGKNIPGMIKIINKKWIEEIPRWASYMEWEVQLDEKVEVAIWKRRVDDTRSWRTAIQEFRKNLNRSGSLWLPETKIMDEEIEKIIREESEILAEMMDDIRKKNRSPG